MDIRHITLSKFNNNTMNYKYNIANTYRLGHTKCSRRKQDLSEINLYTFAQQCYLTTKLLFGKKYL